MANSDHERILNLGTSAWNDWRRSHPHELPDLKGMSLRKRKLSGINFQNADLYRASLWQANLEGADLVGADLSSTTMNGTRLAGANLRRANLRFARLVGADVTDAILSECSLYGCSIWNLKGSPKEQFNVVITPPSEQVITVDNVEIAQFIYLLLNNQKIRHVIDTITSKVVLILGRFTPDRKAVLDSIRDELRKRDYLPVLFDFEKPSNRDITETVSTLAHMARFVIADLSDPKSIPHELAHVVPLLPSVPIMPLIVRPQKEYAMFEHFFGFHHVLKPFRYRDEPHLLSMLNDKVIGPAEKLAFRIAGKRG
jgi:hypothetical protein